MLTDSHGYGRFDFEGGGGGCRWVLSCCPLAGFVDVEVVVF